MRYLQQKCMDKYLTEAYSYVSYPDTYDPVRVYHLDVFF